MDRKLIIEVLEKEAGHLRAGLNYSSDFDTALGVTVDLSSYGSLDNNYLIRGEASKYPKL